MTTKEKIAFRQGVEEGYVKAAGRSGDPETILRMFRPVSPVFRKNAERLPRRPAVETYSCPRRYVSMQAPRFSLKDRVEMVRADNGMPFDNPTRGFVIGIFIGDVSEGMGFQGTNEWVYILDLDDSVGPLYCYESVLLARSIV